MNLYQLQDAFWSPAWLAWMDYLLYPALLIFIAIAAYAFMPMIREPANDTKEDRS